MVFMNGARLGIHEKLKNLFGAQPGSSFGVLRNLAAGAMAGTIGAMVASPFYFVKVRLQSASSNSNIAVGYQHHYTGMWSGFKTIYQSEGIFGLWRGVEGQMLRVGTGSAVQLSTYDYIKRFLQSFQFFEQHTNALPFAASFLTSPVTTPPSLLTSLGFPVAVFMNPVDLVATRLYNQKVEGHKGAFYTGPFDCLYKTFRQEGIRGWFKGTSANYLRLGPHTVCTFVFWEKAKQVTQNIKVSE